MIAVSIGVTKKILHGLLFAVSFMLLACPTQAGEPVRTWLDENTAVTITAQKNLSVFAQRNALPAGSYFDFAGVGAFEINQMGKRHQYLSLLAWSTQLRTHEEQAKFEDNFATFVIWADDKPLTFTRLTRDYATLPVSTRLFKYPGATRSEMYYQISMEQLSIIAAAKKLSLTPAANISGDQPFFPQRDPLATIVAFVDEVAKTNSIKSEVH